MTDAVRRATTLAISLIAILCSSVVARAQTASVRSTRDGIFSAEQAQRGRAGFLWNCMECHELEEYTAAGAYLEEMEGKTVWEVFEFIWSEMPEDNPSWLKPAQYADILAYILSVYGMPAGVEDLPTDKGTLEDIVVQGPSPRGG
jgi:mono/diheme cytochrome c family protein